MQIELFTKPKLQRKIKTYPNSDWIKVTPDFKIGLNFCNHYWYNTLHKIFVALPMEDMFYKIIGKKGYKVSNSFALSLLNGEIKMGDNPFTIIKTFKYLLKIK